MDAAIQSLSVLSLKLPQGPKVKPTKSRHIAPYTFKYTHRSRQNSRSVTALSDMEIFVANIHFNTTETQLRQAVAEVLHSSSYERYSASYANFDVRLFPTRNGISRQSHRGIGTLTVPTEAIGQKFLQDCGGQFPKWPICLLGKTLNFSPGKRGVQAHVLERILRLPYQDPVVLQERQALTNELQKSSISIKSIQFGWETRDGCLSVEWEKVFSDYCELSFSAQNRQIRIQATEFLTKNSLVIHISQVSWIATGIDKVNEPAIFFSLLSHPKFEHGLISTMEELLGQTKTKRKRALYLFDDPDYRRVLPYASLAIRVVCHSRHGLQDFRRLARLVHLRAPRDVLPMVVHHHLFSQGRMDSYYSWIRGLDWKVAFQVEAISRALSADLKEILSIRDRIDHLIDSSGAALAADVLQYFGVQAKQSLWNPEGSYDHGRTFKDLYVRCERDFLTSSRPLSSRRPPSDDLYYSYNVSVTPTTIQLVGPLPDRSNRIMRMYSQDHDSFIRVSFIDENGLQYQHDREVDGSAFIEIWINKILHQGLSVAGRDFRFLGYSQSALKSHTVWFVRHDPNSTRLRPQTIIDRIGKFDNLSFDPDLIRCPARYGARISQAFTATDPSVLVEVEEIMTIDDIKVGRWCFTDGVGTMSKELARGIWKELQRRRKRSARRAVPYPSAFQIRFQGSKGMISIDHRLSGRAICLRHSMIKFEDPNTLGIEIASSFTQPSRYYLNRPLIMILEGLNVPYSVFENLQNDAVDYVDQSTKSLEASARMFDQFGLGTSYRFTSILSSLSKLGVDQLSDDGFYQQMLEFGKHHILRDLKQHARIPVPNGYTLVGVADIHGYLEKGEVFVCIHDQNSSKFYLDGPVLISRSPTIHPGDVQIVNAIGQPPPGSPFEKESLANTVVFSVKGDRPLPSYLGGGDLDGDLYNVTTMPELLPRVNYEPAAYDPAPKKLLDRPSTIDDIADFVADYVNSDVLGLVAITWLVIADQSQHNIFDPACMSLGQIHSDAVDFPKSGQPVPLDKIPRYLFNARPDWNAPETVDAESSADFYLSQKAIGKLFRKIDLPALEDAKQAGRLARRRLDPDRETTLETVLEQLSLRDDEDHLHLAIVNRITPLIDSLEPDHNHLESAIEIFNTYARDLQSICAANTVSSHRGAMLTEEEAVVGTIVAKCSQKKRRKDAMANLREQTSVLVKETKQRLEGEESATDGESLYRAWAAWMVSRSEETSFGAKSFGWIALGEILDGIRAVEHERSQFGW